MRLHPISTLALATLACSGSPPAPLLQAPIEGDVTEKAAPTVVETPEEPMSSENTVETPAERQDMPVPCPSDMKLIDGSYCTEVEQRCIRDVYFKSTNKTVCFEFESPTRCVGRREDRRYCIDTYEWPNVAGERPEVMNNFYQAQVKCAAVGKRLCTESEWTMACEGPEMKPFPHGYVRDPLKCNGDHRYAFPSLQKLATYDRKELSRLWRGVPSGSQPDCISDYGVADMPANVDEVAFNEERTTFSKNKYDIAITGGNWYLGVRNQCRPKVYTHDEGWSYYFLGFRCCAEADGEPTDPRGPRQVARKWEFSRVESLARITREQVREALEKKKAGQCRCADRDRTCRILCGDMLGPDAVDADPNRVPESN